MKVQYFLLLGFLSLSVTFFSSCGSKSNDSRSEYLRPAEVEYNSSDTIEVKSLVDDFVVKMRNGDIEGTSLLLYTLKGDSILGLSEENSLAYINFISTLPIYDVNVISFLLRNNVNNEVKLKLLLADPTEVSYNDAPSTTLSLNPVRVDGQWYLTLLDKNSEGVVDIYQEELKKKHENDR